jgi:hypothetical protein
MSPSEPPDSTFSHVPDNVRAEAARRRTSLIDIAPQMPMSYATLKRRLEHPETLTLREVGQLARVLRVPIERLMQPVNGASEVRS